MVVVDTPTFGLVMALWSWGRVTHAWRIGRGPRPLAVLTSEMMRIVIDLREALPITAETWKKIRGCQQSWRIKK